MLNMICDSLCFSTELNMSFFLPYFDSSAKVSLSNRYKVSSNFKIIVGWPIEKLAQFLLR